MSTSITAAPRTAQTSYVFLVAIAILVALCYGATMADLYHEWNKNEDMSHGFFVPLAAGYIAWIKRDQLAALPFAPSFSGPVVLLFAAGMTLIGLLSGSLTLARLGLLVTLSGCVLSFGGWRAVRILAFPLGLLLFMIPIPPVIYGEITNNLQLLASQLAERGLTVLGYSALREGTIIFLPHQQLHVAQACSGIRSLTSLTFFVATYAYLLEDRNQIRVLLLLASVPVAILLNGTRLILTGILGEINTDWTHGVYHDTLGWILFAIALGAMVGCHVLLTPKQKRGERTA